jgi:hypothetical protein
MTSPQSWPLEPLVDARRVAGRHQDRYIRRQSQGSVIPSGWRRERARTGGRVLVQVPASQMLGVSAFGPGLSGAV